MPFGYDLPGIRNPKENQLGLRFKVDDKMWGPPINYSKKISYLKKKMKEHRQFTVSEYRDFVVEYQIIDIDDTVFFSKTYYPGEI